jgi:hypothetical protein
MDLLDMPRPLWAPDNRVARSIEVGPDYKPDWRLRVTEQHLLAISRVEDRSAAVNLILIKERDPFIRQLVRFHTGTGRCVIPDALEYALQCLHCDPTTRIPALIKAMVVAGLTSQQIAAEVGTKPMNVQTYEKLAFDVRRYCRNRLWLRNICFPIVAVDGSPQHHYEARVLAIAYEGGWARLQSLLLTQQSQRSVNAKADLDQFIAILAARALDFVIGLEAQGIPPTQRDVEVLFLAQHRMPMIALPPFSPSERTADPALDAVRNEIDPTVKALSPLARRRITTFLEIMRSPGQGKIDSILGQEESQADGEDKLDQKGISGT